MRQVNIRLDILSISHIKEAIVSLIILCSSKQRHHNTQKITLDAGAIKTETGAQASDSRQTTVAPVLENCYFPNTWLQFAEGESPEDFLVE